MDLAHDALTRMLYDSIVIYILQACALLALVIITFQKRKNIQMFLKWLMVSSVAFKNLIRFFNSKQITVGGKKRLRNGRILFSRMRHYQNGNSQFNFYNILILKYHITELFVWVYYYFRINCRKLFKAKQNLGFASWCLALLFVQRVAF